MENSNPIIGKVNNFTYAEVNGIKYFIGDFVTLSDDPDQKHRIESISPLQSHQQFGILHTSHRKGKSNICGIDHITGFYYKKDQKKYGIQKKPRVYEGDPNTVVKDAFGHDDMLSNMTFYKGRLLSLNHCVKVMEHPNSEIFTYILKSDAERFGYFECYLSKLYYQKSRLDKAFIVKDDLTVDLVYVNKVDSNSLLSTHAKYFAADPRLPKDSIKLINGEELLDKKSDIFTIGPKSGMIVKKDKLRTDDNYKRYDNGYYFPEFSNLQSKSNDINHNYRFGLDSNTHLITEGLKYTFGVEIEMADCCFPPHFFTDMNIKVEKDGSIKNTRGEKYGPEVITGVLKGDRGFEHLQYICTELAKRSEINYTCGIHTHVGNANFNNANIVMLFKLAKALEKDIFNMLPASRRKNEFCRELPNLDFNFNNCTSVMDLKIRIDNYYTELFTLAANCPPNDKVNKTRNHPKGAKVGYDHKNIRYCWLNFIPALFNTRNSNPPAYTIEFRPFNASTNFIKIKNWIKICMAIVNFAENYHKDIINNYIMFDNVKEPITLKNVMRKVYPKSHRKLNEFIDSRTQIFTQTPDEDVDTVDDVKLKIKELI